MGDQTVGSNGALYTWDGVKWTSYIVVPGTGYLPLSGGSLTGPLQLAGDAISPLEPPSLRQLDAVIAPIVAGYLPLTGGTLTGPLTVPSLVASNDIAANNAVYANAAGSSRPGIYGDDTPGAGSYIFFEASNAWRLHWQNQTGDLTYYDVAQNPLWQVAGGGDMTSWGQIYSVGQANVSHVHSRGGLRVLGDATIDNQLILSGTYGLMTDGSSWMKFHWNGSYPYFMPNGSGAWQGIATHAWVDANFTYKLNQDVNWRASPTFWDLRVDSNLTVSGGAGIMTDGGTWFKFHWNGTPHVMIDGWNGWHPLATHAHADSVAYSWAENRAAAHCQSWWDNTIWPNINNRVDWGSHNALAARVAALESRLGGGQSLTLWMQYLGYNGGFGRHEYHINANAPGVGIDWEWAKYFGSH